MRRHIYKAQLLAATTLCGALAAVISSEAFALQTSAPDSAQAMIPTQTTPPDAKGKDSSTTEVIVTGSIIRKKNYESISPVTVVGSADLEKRGETTIDSVVQNLSGNNAGALPNSFSSNGAFAAGASGASLRGLTTNSTLVLVDGMRMAYYPLADDGARNFVDLNTIPDAIVDHVDVLQDGASSTYGADAIGGVINIVTKKQFQGLTMTAGGGANEQGHAGVQNLAVTWGKGDLAADGYNLYVSGEYQKNDTLWSRDLGYPYNTADFSGLCGASSLGNVVHSGVVGGMTCRTNGVQNGIQFDNTLAGIGTTIVPVVRPYNAANTAAQGNYQLLNPGAGCGGLTPITLTSAQAAIAGTAAGTTLCQQDNRKLFSIVSPEDTRISFSGRLTKVFTDNLQGYVEGNFYQNKVFYTGTPAAIRATTTPAATGVTVSTGTLALPVYICPRGTTAACTAANGTLNPNNPFASAGDVARIFYSFGDIPFYTQENSRTMRLAAGLKGSSLGWDWSLDGTAMKTDLDTTMAGRLYYQHLLDVVADGSYNFLNPSMNTAAVRSYVSPTYVQKSDSEMVDLEASGSHSMWELPGGTSTLAVGGSFRYERIDDPSANPDTNGANNRYFTINPFGAIGFRNIDSAFFEYDAPLLPKLDINVSGRADSYSTHFAAFSPKFAGKYKVLDNLTVRASFSKGFRAPSFAETNAVPNTGFVTVTAPTSFLAAHNNDGYGSPYSLGLTTVSSTGLKPEKSENSELGVVFQPTKTLSFSADYYIITKKDVIASGDYNPAISAYFADQPIPAGLQVVAGPADPQAPTAKALPAFVIYGLQNLNKESTAGMDFQATGRFILPHNVKWTSTLTSTYIQYLFIDFPGGSRQRYDGTLGPYQITSASGTPKWRTNWQNNLDFGKLSISTTTYYTSGYREIATDNGDGYYDACSDSGTAAKYRDGATQVSCTVKAFVDTDAHGSYQITPNYSVMLDIENLFGAKAPYDPTTYGGSNYNPAWANSGVVGRFWKLTAKATF